MSTRVLLVSRGMFHDGLLRVLENHAGEVEVVGSAKSWRDAKALIDQLHPDALIADHQFAEEMMADMEEVASNKHFPQRMLFVVLDENKIILYQREQLTNITIDRLLEVL